LQHCEHHAFFKLRLWAVHLTAEDDHFLTEDEQLDVF